MDALGPWHLLLILLGFVLLFGYRKLPEASRSLGRSLRIFRTELQAAADDVQPAAAPSADDLEREAAAADALAAQLRAAAQANAAAQAKAASRDTTSSDSSRSA